MNKPQATYIKTDDDKKEARSIFAEICFWATFLILSFGIMIEL